MISRALKILLIGSWLFALVQAYVAVESRMDEGPLQASAGLVVTSWAANKPAATVYEDLQAFAKERQITVAREVSDVEQGQGLRHLYFVDGDPSVPGDKWLADGVGNVGSGAKTAIHPLAELDAQTPLGRYVVFGDVSKAYVLTSFFNDKGMNVEPGELNDFVGTAGDWRTALLIVLILAGCVAGIDVVSSARTDAIQRLHGVSTWSRRLASLRRLAPAWAIGGVVLLAIAWVALALRGETVALPLLVRLVAVQQVMVVLVVVVAQLVAGGLIASLSIPKALKGELPGSALTLSAYGLRIAAAFIALGAMATSIQVALDVAERSSDQTVFDALDEKSTVSFGLAYTDDAQAELRTTVGKWVRGLDQRGKVVLAAQEDLTLASSNWAGTSALIVNSQFTKEQDVREYGGRRFVPAVGDAVTVLVPPNRWDDRGELETVLGLDALVTSTPDVKIHYVKSVSEQRLFAYKPQSTVAESRAPMEETYLVNPVVVYLPSKMGWLNDDSYSAYASQGSILFESPQRVKEEVGRDPDLQRFILATTPVATTSAEVLTANQAELRRAVFLVAVASLVVIMTGFAAALVQAGRRQQEVFVKHVHGWSLPRIYLAIAAVEAALVTVVGAWIPFSISRDRAGFEKQLKAGAIPPLDPPTLSGSQLVAILVLLVLLTLSFWTALTLAHWQILRREIAHR